METYYPDELYHYGRLGMKWGKHIFGKDKRGSSKRRSGSDDESSNSQTSSKTSTTPKKKSLSEMTDEEINQAIARKQLENRYKELYPPTVSKGKQFLNKTMKDVVVPAVSDTGKKLLSQYMEEYGKEALGLTPKNSMESLQKEANKLKLQKDIAQYKKDIAGLTSKKKSSSDLDEISKNLERDAKILKNKRSIVENEEWFKSREGQNAVDYEVKKEKGKSFVDNLFDNDSIEEDD